MNQGFGREVPAQHARRAHQPVSRFVVVIASGEVQIARLFLANHVQVAEFDAGSEDLVLMLNGAAATSGASGAEWDRALAGHSAEERAGATVYVLDV